MPIQKLFNIQKFALGLSVVVLHSSIGFAQLTDILYFPEAGAIYGSTSYKSSSSAVNAMSVDTNPFNNSVLNIESESTSVVQVFGFGVGGWLAISAQQPFILNGKTTSTIESTYSNTSAIEELDPEPGALTLNVDVKLIGHSNDQYGHNLVFSGGYKTEKDETPSSQNFAAAYYYKTSFGLQLAALYGQSQTNDDGETRETSRQLWALQYNFGTAFYLGLALRGTGEEEVDQMDFDSRIESLLTIGGEIITDTLAWSALLATSNGNQFSYQSAMALFSGTYETHETSLGLIYQF